MQAQYATAKAAPARVCDNIECGNCHGLIHRALEAMHGDEESQACGTVSKMFPPREYPVFENGMAFRYLREYAPLHLPQVMAGLLAAYRGLSACGRRPRTVLDIGSGPATVALALQMLIGDGTIADSLAVDCVEPSSEFCDMIEKARSVWPEQPVALNAPLMMTMEQYLEAKYVCEADWVVMANVLSPLAAGSAPADTACRLMERLFEVQRKTGISPAVTLIEGSCRTYLDPYACLNAIGERFHTVVRVGHPCSVSLNSPHILKCGYYRKPVQKGCKPRLTMLTITEKGRE